MMKQPIFYESIPRKFRPKKFREVIGQNAIVQTLENALKENHLAHAYLFAGGRGSGKTTLARILAKALCCENPEGIEPCGYCSSCKDIQSGNSLDVIEIDGASNRGIDDIRSLSETTLYAPSYSRWKIYIIDEVHMLTKEAFNALLKTLEEPPEKVKFFFATTEPHKILPTIISRCQRFDFARISEPLIIQKLQSILSDLERSIDQGGLELLAKKASGSLRDAESLLDQILAYTKEPITKDLVIEGLGLCSEEDFSSLDQAAEKEDFSFPFSFVEKLSERGKDFGYFLEGLLTHFRNHTLKVLQNKPSPYKKETLFWILDEILEEMGAFSKRPSEKIALEMLLLRIIRAKKRVSIDRLFQRLEEIESSISSPIQEKAVLEKTSSPPEKQESFPPNTQEQALPEKKPSLPDEKLVLPVPFSVEKPKETSTPTLEKKAKQDTLLRFASVVFEGRIQKK